MTSFVEHHIEQLQDGFLPSCAEQLVSPVRDRAWLRRWLLALCNFFGEFSSVLSGAVKEAPDVHRSALQDRLLFNNLRRHVLALQAGSLTPSHDSADGLPTMAELAPSFEAHSYAHFLVTLPLSHGYAAAFAGILAVELLFDAAWQTIHAFVLRDIPQTLEDADDPAGPPSTSDSEEDGIAPACSPILDDPPVSRPLRRRRPAGLATVALPWLAPPATSFVRWAARHADAMFLYASESDRALMVAAFDLVPHYHFAFVRSVARAATWPAAAAGVALPPRHFLPLSIPWCPGGRGAWEGDPDLATVDDGGASGVGLYMHAVGNGGMGAGTAGAVVRDAAAAAAAANPLASTGPLSSSMRRVASPVPRSGSPRLSHATMRGAAGDTLAAARVDVTASPLSRLGATGDEGRSEAPTWLRRPRAGGATDGPLLQPRVEDLASLAASPLARSRRDWAELLWGSAFKAGRFEVERPLTAPRGRVDALPRGDPHAAAVDAAQPARSYAAPAQASPRPTAWHTGAPPGTPAYVPASPTHAGSPPRYQGVPPTYYEVAAGTPSASAGAAASDVGPSVSDAGGRAASPIALTPRAEVASDSTGLRTFIFASPQPPAVRPAGSGRAAAAQLAASAGPVSTPPPKEASRRPQRISA